MAPLTDPEILAKFRYALELWHFTGYVTWKSPAREWVERNLEGWTTRAVGEEMFLYFSAGGQVGQVRETRREWSEQRYHYDLRVQIGAG